jgi:hypothetical protein
MDKATAEKLIKAFGPCSTIYECSSPNELIDRFNDFNKSMPEFVKFSIEMEELFWERQGMSNTKFIADIKERCKANGFI